MTQAAGASYRERWNGSFRGMLAWSELDALWDAVRARPEGWFAITSGEPAPTAALPPDALIRLVSELDALLRQEHRHDYCGIVYADDREHPVLVKVYDPNNLGSACSGSTTATPPRWVLSRLQPEPIDDPAPLPGSRRRWWQRALG